MRQRLVVVQLDPFRVDQDGKHSFGDACSRIELRIALMQPDFPDPVVGHQQVRHQRDVCPAGVPGYVLAEPGDERRGALRAAVVDVAEPHQA